MSRTAVGKECRCFADRAAFQPIVPSCITTKEWRFRDVTKEANQGPDRAHYGLGVVASDFDADGWPDIYMHALHAQHSAAQQQRRYFQRCRMERRNGIRTRR